MARSRKTAKEAGSKFERLVADYLSFALGEDARDRQIDRQARTTPDTGDIRGIYLHQEKVAIECKDTAKPEWSRWLREAEAERFNADAEYGVVVHKRHGKAQPTDQLVTMTLETFAQMLAGGRDITQPFDELEFKQWRN